MPWQQWRKCMERSTCRNCIASTFALDKAKVIIKKHKCLFSHQHVLNYILLGFSDTFSHFLKILSNTHLEWGENSSVGLSIALSYCLYEMKEASRTKPLISSGQDILFFLHTLRYSTSLSLIQTGVALDLLKRINLDVYLIYRMCLSNKDRWNVRSRAMEKEEQMGRGKYYTWLV